MKFLAAANVLLFLASTAHANNCSQQYEDLKPFYKDTKTARVIASEDAYPEVLKRMTAIQFPSESEMDATESSLRQDFATAYPLYIKNYPGCAGSRLLLARLLMSAVENNPSHRHEVAEVVRASLLQPKPHGFLEAAIDMVVFEDALKQNLLTLSPPDVLMITALRTDSRHKQLEWMDDFKKVWKVEGRFSDTQSAEKISAVLRAMPELDAVSRLKFREFDYNRSVQAILRNLASKAGNP